MRKFLRGCVVWKALARMSPLDTIMRSWEREGCQRNPVQDESKVVQRLRVRVRHSYVLELPRTGLWLQIAGISTPIIDVGLRTRQSPRVYGMSAVRRLLPASLSSS